MMPFKHCQHFTSTAHNLSELLRKKENPINQGDIKGGEVISFMQQENNLPFLPKYPKQTAEEPVLKDKNIL